MLTAATVFCLVNNNVSEINIEFFQKMDSLNKPLVICHIEKSVNFTLYDCKWIPCSAKFVVLGTRPNHTGIIQIYELNKGQLELVNEFGKDTGFKCGTFGASNLRERYLATGGWKGKLQVWNLEKNQRPVYTAHKHTNVINAIDGIGGVGIGCGAPEIVTGSADGSVMVWDVRQRDEPVAHMQPREGESRRDCWAVAAGNSYNADERVIASAYDNGDVKMFDLRNMSVQWETNVRNGVCGLEFDRKDIVMNKLVAVTLENKIHAWDLRTHHPKKGFTGIVERNSTGNHTVWTCRHLPQNRDLFATTGGSGSICLWKYNYPEKRVVEDGDGLSYGVAGSLTILQNTSVSSQPVTSLDWSPDKLGLAVCTSLDQTLRVVIATKLNLY